MKTLNVSYPLLFYTTFKKPFLIERSQPIMIKWRDFQPMLKYLKRELFLYCRISFIAPKPKLITNTKDESHSATLCTAMLLSFLFSHSNKKRGVKGRGQYSIIVLFKSLQNFKRRKKGNFTLKSNSNKIILCGVGWQHYLVLNKISAL